MKKKLVSALLVAVMAVTTLAGCGNAKAKDGGKVLNIYCWNEEFKDRMSVHYPGMEIAEGSNTGKIGDVTVNFVITPNTNNAYQEALDSALLKQGKAKANDKVDIFLVEADYALKYVDTEYALPIKDLGITDADLANQYQYTKDVVTDGKGQLKGSSWQACPGLLIYRRDMAKEVLGTDDPDAVQAYVKDWATFQQTAALFQEKGYHMVSSVNDTYRTFSNNVTTKWVENGQINIDANIENWVKMSKEMYDAKQTDTYQLWGDDWSKGFFDNGDVFCYFGPAWFADFCMSAGAEGAVATRGGWAATEGPQGFYWGGTWVCAAQGTDNSSLVKDIILKLTCDKTIMTNIVKQANDFVNYKSVMEEMAKDTTYGSAVYGGQNALGKYCAGVETIDLSKISIYDQGCNESFQNAMKDYFEGTATYEQALEIFYKSVYEKYPELKK